MQQVGTTTSTAWASPDAHVTGAGAGAGAGLRFCAGLNFDGELWLLLRARNGNVETRLDDDLVRQLGVLRAAVHPSVRVDDITIGLQTYVNISVAVKHCQSLFASESRQLSDCGNSREIWLICL